ncbi:3-oxoacyl-[acyl-carrier protein] reductase [Actinopolyspora biskrensis]|uniref:3-oxoacyl-[acyl-carrier protein] reductase n=2 Tax=Actinopolyspora biskrensis TaxID=1470178 RepID=A0A852Z9M8_9ACTN|nr:3-oxoacyl-[acyl-carrier protein] reductase [Actinopolyspora biskrensis]
MIDHSRYRHHEIDLTDGAQVRSMFRAIRREFGHLDVLVNNAGTAVMNHFMMTPEETAREVFDLNFFAVLNCCREAAKLLQKSPEESGAILNISTVAVPWALDGQLVYSASKSAVEQLTRVMSKELVAFGIRVNGVGVPPVRTALTRTLARETLDAVIARQTMGRMCEMEDIVGPVDFLTTGRSGFVTGETLYLGGIQ